MRPVIIESPYAGDIERNIIYLRRCIRDSIFRCGESPMASHRMFTDALSEETERALGIEAGYAWWKAAEMIVFYDDYGMSPGMKKAFDRCYRVGKAYHFRNIGLNP